MKPFGNGARGGIVTSAMVDFTLKRIKECRPTSHNLASMPTIDRCMRLRISALGNF